MKTIFILKLKFTKLLALLLLLPSFVGVGGGLYAQDPELFEHTWYLQKVVIGTDDYFPPSNAEVEFVGLTFYDNSSNEFDTNVCNGFFGELDYVSTQSFIIQDSAMTLLECDMQDNSIFEGIYFGFFLDSNNHLNDPFPFVITTNGSENTLIITNVRGDEAIYGNQILSTGFYEQTLFSIYPNPVKNTLNIQSQNNYLSDASVQVFDISGKLVEFKVIDLVESNNGLNVSHLKSGLYFLTIKNKNGNKQTLKFIKQ